jgi:hypothetical protein
LVVAGGGRRSAGWRSATGATDSETPTAGASVAARRLWGVISVASKSAPTRCSTAVSEKFVSIYYCGAAGVT